VGLKIFQEIFFDIPHIQTEYGESQRIFRGILSVPHNVVMIMNNAIKGTQVVYVNYGDIKVLDIP
jgi:hypothetical protein